MIELFRNIQFDWLNRRRLFFALSVALLLAGMGSILAQGLQYGVDFEAGAIVYVRFDQQVPIEDIRQALRAGAVPDDEVQELGGAGTGYNVLIRVGESFVQDDLGRGREAITAALGEV